MKSFIWATILDTEIILLNPMLPCRDSYQFPIRNISWDVLACTETLENPALTEEQALWLCYCPCWFCYGDCSTFHWFLCLWICHWCPTSHCWGRDVHLYRAGRVMVFSSVALRSWHPAWIWAGQHSPLRRLPFSHSVCPWTPMGPSPPWS